MFGDLIIFFYAFMLLRRMLLLTHGLILNSIYIKKILHISKAKF